MKPKFKPGTAVVINRVPDPSESESELINHVNYGSYGVVIGTTAIVEDVAHVASLVQTRYARERGLTIIRVKNYRFWWREEDLRLVQ